MGKNVCNDGTTDLLLTLHGWWWYCDMG